MPEPIESRERGQSIILVAIAMLALVIFAAIAVDISHAYVQRRTAQNGADGAALAGARALRIQISEYGTKLDKKGSQALIKAAMNDYAERNGIADTDGVLANQINTNVEGYWLATDQSRIEPIDTSKKAPPVNARGIEAVTTIQAETFFGGIIGLDGLTLHAEAAVTLYAGVCGVTCVVPIATYWVTDTGELTQTQRFLTSDLPNPMYVISDSAPLPPNFTCYNIWNGADPGNFGWLNWVRQEVEYGGEEYACRTSHCSAECLEENLDPLRCIGYLEIGDWVAGTTGVVNKSAVQLQLNLWMGWDEESGQFRADKMKAFTVPLYRWTNGLGGCNPSNPENAHAYEVAGFARMQLLGYKLPQGDHEDPWVLDPCRCIDQNPPIPEACGEPPNDGTRLTAVVLELIDNTALPGACEVYGTVTTGRMIR